MKNLLLITIAICLISCQKVQEIQQESHKAQMKNIYQETINQQLKQWDIISRNGTDAEKWVHAQVVAGCYLQAGDEAGYKQWSDKAKIYDPMGK